MRFKRLWAMFTARNLEFFRDRAAFGWNFLFPFLIIAGFGVVFGGKSISKYKAGVFPVESPMSIHHQVEIPEGFQSSKYVEFVGVPSLEAGLALLKHHKLLSGLGLMLFFPSKWLDIICIWQWSFFWDVSASLPWGLY
ncbi:MAG: hypothetical protein WCR46_11300 [Deltaproteobacteria bacterium]